MNKLKELFGTKYLFLIQKEDWTNDDNDDLKLLLSHPKFPVLIKLIHRRMAERTDDLVNGKETRDRIDELKDLLLELRGYGDS